MQLTGTSAIVTGGASGLGAATAAELAAAGASVVAVDLARSIESAPDVDGVVYVEADVTDEAQVRNAVAAAGEHGPLRVAVSCAGIGTAGRVLGKGGQGIHDLGAFARTVNVNLVGTFTVLAVNIVASWLRVVFDPQEREKRHASLVLGRGSGT